MFGLDIFIYMYIVIYKYSFYNIIMMGFRKSKTTYTDLFPFEENGAQFGVISGENKKIYMSCIQTK